MILGCIYRHPSSEISIKDFSIIHIEPLLEKIVAEQKECVLMGDINVDLLKYSESNSATEFYNNLFSNFFTPFVLQPTRLKAKTLIDNIIMT